MSKRNHRATYARDKYSGGFNIRVEGPRADAFVGREVPVERKDGSEEMEKLTAIVWKGADNDGKPVALYRFEPKEREPIADVEF